MKYKTLSRLSLVLSIIGAFATINSLLYSQKLKYEIIKELNDNPFVSYKIDVPNMEVFETFSGTASILGLFFTFFFRYKDKKEQREAIEKNNLGQTVLTKMNSDLSETDDSSDKKRADLSIDEKTYDDGIQPL